MSTCETCRYMAPEHGLTYCSRIKAMAPGPHREPAEIAIEAYGTYGSEATAKLVVLPTFGCVLWEEP